MWKILFLVYFFDFIGCEKSSYPDRIPQYQRSRLPYKPVIVGGISANISEYPHLLALIEHKRFICGASIISLKWALTAAHCLESGKNPKILKLYGGSTSRMSGGIQFDVEKYKIHPDYDWFSLDYDVAVMKTTSQFEGPNIRPTFIANEICYTGKGTNVRLAGWGLNDQFELPEYLLQICQTTISSLECKRYWGNDITDRMMCASTVEGSDSCDGDSGGPVMNDFLQVGVISFGSLKCGDSKIPSVFARIEEPAIRKFIRQQANV